MPFSPKHLHEEKPRVYCANESASEQTGHQQIAIASGRRRSSKEADDLRRGSG